MGLQISDCGFQIGGTGSAKRSMKIAEEYSDAWQLRVTK
jgi:hypothetical protein